MNIWILIVIWNNKNICQSSWVENISNSFEILGSLSLMSFLCNSFAFLCWLLLGTVFSWRVSGCYNWGIMMNFVMMSCFLITTFLGFLAYLLLWDSLWSLSFHYSFSSWFLCYFSSCYYFKNRWEWRFKIEEMKININNFLYKVNVISYLLKIQPIPIIEIERVHN